MGNRYTISEFISTSYSFLLTKLFDPKARLIRRPAYLRGKQSLSYEKGLTTGHGCRFDLKGDAVKRLHIGENCEIGDYVHIVAHDEVVIGKNVLIASKVFITDTSHGTYTGPFQDSPKTSPNDRKLSSQKVIIGDNVWIGENVVILPGVSIGDGSIIGANSVVTKSIPSDSIVVGAPASVIKYYDFEQEKWILKEK